MLRGFAVLGLLLGLAAPVAAQRTGGTGDCDRACLTGIADAYIAALVAHTPSKAPLASNVKFTEQAQLLEVGEGLWKTTTQGPTTFKIAVADPIAGQVGMIVMMKAELGPPPVNPITGAEPPVPPGPADVQLAFRLKVQKKQITEAKQRLLPRTAPAARTACTRRVSGRLHRSQGRCQYKGCGKQLTSRAMSYITSIDLRRVWIADEEKGLVFGLTMFRHPMTEKFVTILNPDGTTTQRPWNFNPFDLEAVHIFKISGGKIHEIEAMGFTLPLYSKNGWSPFIR
jgi:hypothetical protein